MTSKAEHRAHQSAYREEVLGLPPGLHKGEPLGNLLPEKHDEEFAAEAGWNLMSPAARSYTAARLPVVRRAHGLVQKHRLWHNMLSSQPLAFSIVGELRAHEQAALAVLGQLTGLDLAAFDRLDSGTADDQFVLDGLQAEWAPPKEHHTGDKSAFDIAAAARTAAGERALVSIEVKYVDRFSAPKIKPGHYDFHGLAINAAVVQELVDSGASQFLRSVLLTESVRRRGLRGDDSLDKAVALMLCRDGDKTARKVVDAVANACATTDLAITLRTHDELFDAAAAQPALHDWALAMRRRYLKQP